MSEGVIRPVIEIPLHPPAPPPDDDQYRPFLIASLSLATLVGFVLGIHVPLGRLLGTGDPERTTDLLHAHGQVQLLGFAGLFVIGMSLRLMPRFAGGRLGLPFLLKPTLWLLLGGLLLRSLVLPWLSGDTHAVLLAVASFIVLCGSACFVLIVVATLGVEARRSDASTLAFNLGAGLLLAATTVACFAAIKAAGDGQTGLPYLANTAVLQLELLGFLASFIIGVALRAIPNMVGRERPGRGASTLAVVLAMSVAILAAALLWLEYVSYDDAVVLIADAAFLSLGLVLLTLAALAGSLRPAANRLRPASQPHFLLVRSAFAWMVFAGLASLYFGAKGLLDVRLPDNLQFDAVRHALGAGVVTMLIAGMASMILPEFAGERMTANRQRLLALVLTPLLNAAALLRVLPSLAGSHWSTDDRNLSMAVAGSLAEAALLLFAFYFFRLLWRARKARAATA